MMPFVPWIVIILLGLIFYFFSVRSRKSYRCPQCGERIRVEHMEAENCNMCGAPLKKEAE